MIKKLIIAIFLIISLYGCVAAIPAALLIGATAGGAIVYDNRSFKQIRTDHDAAYSARYWIQRKLNNAYNNHIVLTVYNGIGLLVGEVDTTAVKKQAYIIMSRIKGINKIYNGLIIAAPTSTIQQTNDTIITGKVRSSLLTEQGLRSNNIKVVTENSIVYLLGSVPREQAALAANATRQVSGVLKVIKVFEYI